MARMIIGNWDEVKTKLETKIKEIFKDKDISKMSKYEIRRTIFDYLCDTLTYDLEYLKNIRNPEWYRKGGSRDSYLEFETVLINNIGVCNGISQLYILLLEMVGINSKYIICDTEVAGRHALTLVYDEEHDLYSLDDITSVIVGLGDKEKYFDYTFDTASLYGQGNKSLFPDSDNKWVIIGKGYIDYLVGRKTDKLDDFEEIPSNIGTVRELIKKSGPKTDM